MTAVAATRTTIDLVAALIERGARQARRRGCPVAVSGWLRVPGFDPVSAFERAETGARALWLQPDAGFAMVGSGTAARFVREGPDGFARAAAWWRELVRGTVTEAAEGPLPAPVCLGGFAFDPAARRPAAAWRVFADADLAAPAVTLVSRDNETWALLTARAQPEDEPEVVAGALAAHLGRLLESNRGSEEGSPRIAAEEPDGAPWREAVREAVDAIGRGALLKVVLAREVVARAEGVFPLGQTLRRLRNAYGGCTVFAFDREGTVFLGATPERLVRLDGQRVEASCLAGSRRRGATPDEDEALGQALRSDRKERFEHALVVRALRDALEPLCEALELPDEPELLRLRNVQHLYTPVEGTNRGDTTVLDLVARLHPTPAVGGVPRQAALEVIQRSEPFDRGWYAGPVGWIDGTGSGEFVVALRSALVCGGEARLYAGCGIVAGSDPGREWDESDAKLRAMRWALNLPTAEGSR